MKAQRREDYLQRIPFGEKFGQGKNGYRLSYIRAKWADTAFAWINSIFLAMNLAVLRRIFFALRRGGVVVVLLLLLPAGQTRLRHRDARTAIDSVFGQSAVVC